MQAVQILIHAHDDGGIQTELNVARCSNAHCFLSVIGHLLCVKVHCAALRSQDLVLPAAHLAPPLLPVHIEHGSGFFGIDQNGSADRR